MSACGNNTCALYYALSDLYVGWLRIGALGRLVQPTATLTGYSTGLECNQAHKEHQRDTGTASRSACYGDRTYKSSVSTCYGLKNVGFAQRANCHADIRAD